jgi:hypothetical protein
VVKNGRAGHGEKSPAGMVKNRPKGGGYSNSYFYKLLFSIPAIHSELAMGGR